MGDRRARTTELLAGGDKEEEEMAAGLIRRKKYDYGRQRRPNVGGCSAPKLDDFERGGAARFKHPSTFRRAMAGLQE
ncbi:hypothetical protein EAG_11596 [Camponotus floridanus]|uniref:Uncharacterized protein n=1 Tax=Camponotus floridanus TaxID=104421 RepID=E2A4K5_CAMFO|nr:hypothetical protein EAG_11596 [Camponotus floridanus]